MAVDRFNVQSPVSSRTCFIDPSGTDSREANTVSPGTTATNVKERGRRRAFLLTIVGGAAFAGIAVGAWLFVRRDHLVPKRFGVVIPGEVYRSGQISRHLIADVIDRYHIGTIIDLNGFDSTDPDQVAEVAVAEAKGIHHVRFPLRGNGTGQIDRYANAVETLVHSQRSGIPALVHCYAGTQRTGACLSFYRLLVRGDRADEVYEDLGRYGWDSATDQVLLDYVNSHMRVMAERLVQKHVLERVPDPIPRLHP